MWPKGCQPSVAFPICWALIAILTRHMLEHSFLSISMWIISDMPKECKHFYSDAGTCWRVFVCKAAIPSSNQHTNNHSSHTKNQTPDSFMSIIQRQEPTFHEHGHWTWLRNETKMIWTLPQSLTVWKYFNNKIEMRCCENNFLKAFDNGFYTLHTDYVRAQLIFF